MSTNIVSIPFHETQISAADINGVPNVALRPACESMGLDYSGQRQRLERTSWATMGVMPTVGADGRTRDMVMIDRRTFTMWLATISTSRIKDASARRMIEKFQNEAADALDAYFSMGVAVRPATSEDPAERNLRISKGQLELIQFASTIAQLDPAYVNTMTSIAVEKGLGNMPHMAPEDQGLYTEDYLKERGHSGQELKSLRSRFGRLISVEYQNRYGTAPMKSVGEVGGRARAINYYTERDRGLFDHVYAAQIAPKLKALS